MPLKKLLLGIFVLCSFLGSSQATVLSNEAQISILTCGAGDELYSAFGHTAIRVQDLSAGIDEVYNYGTFNFNQPNFYLKFVRGKLFYSLSKSKFPEFLYDYEFEKRWIKEQILNVTQKEKLAVYQFLQKNYKPGNRDYKYDYLFNNCSTKIPEILQKVLPEKLQFNHQYLSKKYTFRELIHQNLHINSWSSFGIDLALGSVIDQQATAEEHMFLPSYVMQQLNNTTLAEKPLVLRERTVLDFAFRTPRSYILSSPAFWLSALFIFVLIITYIDIKNKVRSRWLDFFLFFITGMAGLLLFSLWFLTDHSATANNFNILWAFPINLIVAFYVFRKKSLPKWVWRYVVFVLCLLALTFILWIVGTQAFNPFILPVLLSLAIRYFWIYTTTKSIYA